MGMLLGFFVFVSAAVISLGAGEQAVTGELVKTPLAKVVEFLPARVSPRFAQCNNVNPDCNK